MTDTLIENPILNSPFAEPSHHFKFDESGITSEIAQGRRTSAYFRPIPGGKRTEQTEFQAEWTGDRLEENAFINRVRRQVSQWRQGGRPNVTPTTNRLLEHWTAEPPERGRRLFFAQVEAVETAIYLTEVASRYGDGWIEQDLRDAAEAANPALFRVALKMATGSGKTVVMGMLIAWQCLNKRANPQDNRFSDAFLIVAPGITIRDRLRVLLPEDPNNYYREMDLVPASDRQTLGEAKVVITNFHTFQLREKVKASKTTKSILARRRALSAFTETPEQMVNRVCRDLGTKRQIVVLNDEAHHCYRAKPDHPEEGENLKGEEKKEAESRDKAARVWVSGLEAIARKVGIKSVYDLSATPFFLRGSGYPEGTLFPWVVSDFSLIDAIEAGLVKIPRVPVADDASKKDEVTYRDLWLRIREKLPKKGRKESDLGGEPRLPAELQGALHSLYGNYEKSFARWAELEKKHPTGGTPPVFIVVCNNTSVSKLVFDYVAGWTKPVEGGAEVVVPGQLPLFSNEQGGGWSVRPRSILVDSEQLESGEAMSDDFKKASRHEIDEFKAEYRTRFPDRDPDELTDEDLLREVMNTVGKRDKLGEQVRCVVSVSMLTEGWDANTVSHILGVRAFGTQLLCEQVVGRGLRRRSYELNDEDRFEPEYAEVYGVPFSFIPAAGTAPDPKPPKPITRVRALAERAERAIEYPRIVGYRHELSTEQLRVSFDDGARFVLSTKDVPSQTEIRGVVGETEIHRLEDLLAQREQAVIWFLARRLLDRYFNDRPWLFPQLTRIVRQWVGECVEFQDNTSVQLFLLHQHADDAVDRVHRAMVQSDPGVSVLLAVPSPHEPQGSTHDVDFNTPKPVFATSADKCHVSHVASDSGWEDALARKLEDMAEVVSYVKNQGLGFTIPYTIDGEERRYVPDFIARIDDARGSEDLLNLIIEVSGAQRRDKEAKVDTTTKLWVPGVNELKTYGRWAFVECHEPENAMTVVRGAYKVPVGAEV